ncbi:MAG: hypothetical protein J5589_09900 [Firmicutes bacterium]|nr:hypothetical protein [Bacillota bacterium]
MKYRKQTLTELDHVYAVSVMQHENEPWVFFAAENRGACVAFDCASHERKKTVWEQPGGTMSMVEIPGREGEFLAVQKFYRLYEWEEACLVWVKPNDQGGFDTRDLFTLPYLHRFDLLQRDGRTFLVVCSLAAHKKTRDDWSEPGSVYAAVLPSDWDGPIELKEILSGCFQNHGYARIKEEAYDVGLSTCEQGVFRLIPPAAGSEDWTIEKIMDQATSDADLIDLDGDGEAEIATIERFHGCYFRIYKKVDGMYQQVYQHPEVSEFYHVVKAGTIAGHPCFVGGCRRGKQQLFVVYWDADTGMFVTDTVEEGVGPSNAYIFNGPQGDVIYSANREAAHAAVYVVEE